MKKVLTYIKSENFHIELAMYFFCFACFACIYCLCNNPTASRPESPTQLDNLKGITIQTPAGYTASEAIKNGKVLSIVWK